MLTQIPFRQWLGQACVCLHWTPETFWRASLIEYFSSIEEYNRMQRAQSGQPEPFSRDEYEALKAKYGG